MSIVMGYVYLCSCLLCKTHGGVYDHWEYSARVGPHQTESEHSMERVSDHQKNGRRGQDRGCHCGKLQ